MLPRFPHSHPAPDKSRVYTLPVSLTLYSFKTINITPSFVFLSLSYTTLCCSISMCHKRTIPTFVRSSRYGFLNVIHLNALEATTDASCCFPSTPSYDRNDCDSPPVLSINWVWPKSWRLIKLRGSPPSMLFAFTKFGWKNNQIWLPKNACDFKSLHYRPSGFRVEYYFDHIALV